MELNLNTQLIVDYLKKEEWSLLTEVLSEECKVMRDESGLVYTKKPTINDINLFNRIIYDLSLLLKDCQSEEVILLIKQCFVSLRNCAASGQQAQNDIAFQSSILSYAVNILNLINNFSNDICQECVVMILQFFGNMVVGNESMQLHIWRQFSEIFLTLLKPTVGRIASTTAMIVYNILRTNRNLLVDDINFIKNIIQLYEMDAEYALLILELIIPTLLVKHYSELPALQRIILLDIIFEMLPNASVSSISTELISFFSLQFKMKSDCILKTVKDYVDKIEPVEVVHLLQVLASASGNEEYLKTLQADKSLLINCIFLLKSIHGFSKEEDNPFSVIQKLSELSIEGGDQSSIREHPGYGFKAALIRLIGNMCYRHIENQTSVRDLECIQLLLDCCNIDARNPFIIQWIILAMRNLCEGNVENQTVIKSMCKISTVDSSVLREIGLDLHSDGENTLGLLPLNINK